ncbi:Protein transport protein Sec31A [Acropora cervicornis]|uniref:Protein transport protein Sec31A n=1 Tax=Acropora cervicornis TaxID=6130 RepID=A0AAD9R5D8_ACRCE|nr:Protein transport protein Sec31A [Acropora cervicornis]
MKVKEVNRTANIAWSPAPHTNAALEIFTLNLSSGDTVMPLSGTLASEHRFHKLVWGSHGIDSSTSSSGLLIGGSDNGLISIYNAQKIISGDTDDSVVFESTKHTGPVQALDINPFKTSLLASGASDSEIFIWDLTNPSSPLTPGSKTLPPDNISCVAWNRQVQHILASASPCGRCVVWDLRKNEPIIKVSDQSAMIRCKAVEWHPDVATQMMWDLRFATSPMKVLEGHQRGILSIAWCPQDPDLLMSCAKITYELPTTSQWSFDVAWCPRNPAMICSSSFDGHVMSAFDADDPFSTQIRQAQQQQQQQQQQQNSAPTSSPLKKPPKWLRRPCGASFSFGGKLISFGQTKDSPIAQVNISQVTTEQELVNRSYELEGALASGSFIQYCNSKVENSTQELQRTLWSFLKINFEREPRRHFLTLLGYDPMELSKKVASSYTSSSSSRNEGGVDAEELVQKMQLLSAGEATNKLGQSVFSSVGEPVKQPSPFQIPTDDDTDGLISQALLTGNFEAAVDVCLYADRMADAFLLAIAGGPDLLARIQTRYFEKSKSHVARNWREALATLVTYAKAEEFTALCDLLGQRLEQEGDEHCANSMVCYICAGNVEKFVSCWTKNMPAEPSPLALQGSLGVLKDRLFNAQFPSHISAASARPPFPFQRIDVQAEPIAQTQTQTQTKSQNQPQQPPLQQQQSGYGVPSQQQLPQQHRQLAQQSQQYYQLQQQQPPSPVPNSSYQPSAPPTQTQFYNPAAYHAQVSQPPPLSQQSFNQTTPPPSQSPYYNTLSQRPPPIAQTQSSWSQPSPMTMYQPQTANAAPTQAPPTGQYGSQGQPPVQIFNPASTLNPGAPYSRPSPAGAPGVGPHPPPSVTPPPPGPPPTEPGAWKDIHIMRSKKPTPAFTPPAPITSPLFNGTADQQQKQQASAVGLPQGAPPGSGAPPMMPPGGGPPGAPPSYGDMPRQQPPQVYDDTPPPSPNHILPHAIHSLHKQVKQVKQALNTC